MAKKNRTAHYVLGDERVTCLYCRNDEFASQEVKLNTTGMSALNLDWANRSATGLVCTRCGYVHLFANDHLQARAT